MIENYELLNLDDTLIQLGEVQNKDFEQETRLLICKDYGDAPPRQMMASEIQRYCEQAEAVMKERRLSKAFTSPISRQRNPRIDGQHAFSDQDGELEGWPAWYAEVLIHSPS